MENENDIEEGELTSRAPTQEDFVGLCARLNELNFPPARFPNTATKSSARIGESFFDHETMRTGCEAA